MDKINVAIIGYGKQGKLRERDILLNNRYNLVCRADTVIDVEYKDYKEMIDKEKLDAVFVCVPHTLLRDINIYCLNKGLDVFSEKPPGINLSDTLLMEEAMKRNNKKLVFGFNHRYHHHIQKAIKEVAKETYGKIMWMRGTYGKAQLESWRQNKELAGRGILLSQGIHLLDIMRVILKASPYTKDEEFISSKSAISRFNGKWFDDNVFTILNSKSTVSTLHSSCVMWKNNFELDICMENGFIKIKGLYTSSKSFGFPEVISISTKEGDFYGNPTEEIHYYGKDTSFGDEINQFVDVIDKNEYGFLGTVDDAKSIMKILDEVYNDNCS